MGTVVVFPRSGYANRLQTIVSTALLADELGMDWRVCWMPQDIAPAEANQVFSDGFVGNRIISPELARQDYGLVLEDIPLYLNVSEDRSSVYLAGHARGEQYFMPDLRRVVSEEPREVIAIVAGGKFTLSGDRQLTQQQDERFREARYREYQRLHLHPAIEDEAARYRGLHSEYLGLHLRYSDRNTQAPWSWSIEPAVKSLAERLGISEVFVASDSMSARDRWVDRLRRGGLDAWGSQPQSMDRRNAASAIGALIDWRLLAGSTAMVYFRESSFAEEACVASGAFSASSGLMASTTRERLIRLREYGHALVTYPARHGPLAR